MIIKIQIELTKKEVKLLTLLNETALTTYPEDEDCRENFIVNCIKKNPELLCILEKKGIIYFNSNIKQYKLSQICLWFLHPNFKEEEQKEQIKEEKIMETITITKTIYKSNDGKEFDTEKECLEYESKNSFETWYSKNSLTILVDNGEDDYNHHDVYFWTILEWLLKNKKEIVNFLFPNHFIFLQELKSLIKKPLDVNDSNDVGILIDDIEILIERYEKILENNF